MFERNRPDVQEQATVAVEITFDNGAMETGRMIVSASRTVFDVLNGPSMFLEFEPFEAERRFIAKSSLKAVKLLAGARPPNLSQKLRDMDGFDPHSILGVKPGSDWETIRGAYLAAAKNYHPDRFANVELPHEVTTYLSGVLRRINASYAALETAQQSKKHALTRQQEAIYVSASRM